jgi:ubiquinone/menaquinone biosynthesis C-methylase UbiE
MGNRARRPPRRSTEPGTDGMDGSYLSKLRVWQDAPHLAVQDLPVPAPNAVPAGPHNPSEFADRLYAWESLKPPTSGTTGLEAPEPYTLQWFLNIENQRHGRQGRWIPRLLEFSKHAGETLLGLGDGLGTDWLQYARHGAAVVVCSPWSDQLALIRRNFELRGLSGRFLHAAPTALPLEAASIDVACVSGLLHQVETPQAVVDEVYRVLKPGGKVLAVTAARFDVDFWYYACFPWKAWFKRKRRTPAGRSARFTSRSLRRLFGRFVDHRVHKRHLNRSEVPHLWRWLPRPVLERLMGQALILKAFKPLSAANLLQVAA